MSDVDGIEEGGARRVADAIEDAELVERVPPDELELARFPKNDIGNADRLIARHGGDLLWTEELGWLAWDDKRWAVDKGGRAAQRRAHQTSRAIREEAKALEEEAAREGWLDDPKKAKPHLERIANHYKWAIGSGNSARIAAMLKEASPYVGGAIDDLDAQRMLLNVENGTLELPPPLPRGARVTDERAEIRLRPPRREDRNTRLAPVIYDPEAAAPQFEAFLERIQPDPKIRLFLQRWGGFMLTGRMSSLIVMFYGLGANGKSTLLNLWSGVLGDYAISLPFASITDDGDRRGGDATPDLVRLPGARLVMVSEPRVGATLSEATIKVQTGGERMQVRPLYREQFEFWPTHKLVASFNNKPKIKAQDEGTWRRLAMVLFGVQIPEAERDDEFAARLLEEEGPGILNWLLDGFRMWREGGLAVPDAVRETTRKYRADSDPIGDFMAAWVDKRAGATERASRLFEAYKGWCRDNGAEPINQTRFGRLLGETGIDKYVSGVTYYIGIELKPGVFVEGSEGSGAPAGTDPRPEPPERDDWD